MTSGAAAVALQRNATAIVGIQRVIAIRSISFLHCTEKRKTGTIRSVPYWEIIAENLKKAGWSYGYVSAVDREGRAIWIADAHRDGKRFIVRADEKLTAFVELESAIRYCVELS